MPFDQPYIPDVNNLPSQHQRGMHAASDQED
jgi:hypothetical protein